MPERLPDTLPPNTPQTGANQGSIATPDLSKGSLKPKNRAIRDVKQAGNIITTLENAARERNRKNARIMAKYNSEKPWRQSSLEADGLGWKSNFTTKPLPMLIDKVAPRFVAALDGMRYLTNSSLDDTTPGAALKTEAFRREITKTIRTRPGWRDFLSSLSQENSLFGFAAVAWLDEFAWFPKFFRQDEFFIPTGTKQTIDSAQIILLKETFLIHELFAMISDKEAASTRGWNIEETVKLINEATPQDRRSENSDYERIYEDMLRESNAGGSFESGPLVVVVWHLLATEIDGKVSHYIFDQKSKVELFSSEDQFPSMSDAAAFYSFQQANGTMAGSKGIGREVYAIAGMLDKSRNEVVDRLNLAGKLILQGDSKSLKRFKMSVVGNAILIDEALNVIERKPDSTVEPFIAMDGFLTSLLDQMAGATTPKVFEGERVTKAQVDFFAAREEETRDNVISRWLTQFATMMTTIQKRICDPQTSEKDAKAMQERLLAVMTKEELADLRKQPVAETIAEFTPLERQQVVVIAQEARGNPLYNQKELERRKLIAQVDEDFAEAVLLPDEDPTETAEQTRLQQFELLLIVGQGAEVPVSPRDNPTIHLQVLIPAMEKAAQSAVENPEGTTVLQACLMHGEAHLAQAKKNAIRNETIDQAAVIFNKTRSQIGKLAQLNQQQEQMMQDAQPSAPVPQPGPVPQI